MRVESFLPTFGAWDEAAAMRDWQRFADQTPGIDDEIASTSLQFIARCYDEFLGRSTPPKAGHAFVVPTRVSRTTRQWADDTVDFAPMLSSADPATRVALLSRLPPFIIDTYRGSAGTHPGVVLFCPLFPDMVMDLGMAASIKLGRDIAERTLAFAERLGVELAGLGGTLPSVTHYGQRIETRIPTTSGHGGTLALLRFTIERACTEGDLDSVDRVAVVGAGAIGTSAALDLASLGASVQLIDTSDRARALAEHRIRQTQYENSITVSPALSNPDKLQLVVGAATTPIHLEGLDEDTLIVDDSQPPCVLPAQGRASARNLRWVVGTDTSEQQIATRQSYRFGREGLLDLSDVWGCEAEAAALAAHGDPDMRLTTPVNPTSTAAIQQLFSAAGIQAAQPQAFGQLSANKPTN